MKYIDLFCGIGGFHLGLAKHAECVFACDIDPNCRETYKKNFGLDVYEDITKITPDEIPDHNILCAGFPCQAFSLSGKRRGFNDPRGQLIFYVQKIVAKKKPEIVLLENVKHLIHHDKGQTFQKVLDIFKELNYFVSWKILNAKDFGVAQNRERLIIVCSKYRPFSFSNLTTNSQIRIKDILEPEANFEYLSTSDYTLIQEPKEQISGLIFVGYRNKNIRKKGIRLGTEHLSRVHKQPNRIYSSKGVHPTIPSQESAGRFFILHKNRVRKLTILECFRLMGFPDTFIKLDTKAKLYNQIGNSVCVPMVRSLTEGIVEHIENGKELNA